jgi:hypothetical protein
MLNFGIIGKVMDEKQPKDIGARTLIHPFLGGTYFERFSIFFSA